MNKGTKLRTLIAAIACFNVCLIVGGIGFTDPQINLIYKLASVIVMVITWSLSHYFNNDFSEESAEHTGLMRLRKQSKLSKFIGENFFDEVEEVEDDEECNI